jgi:ribosomal protein S18 acetylase RimI-like enzyme
MFRSRMTEAPLTLHSARLAVVSPDDLPFQPPFRGSIRPADLSDPHDHNAIKAINELYWGCLEQDVFGRTYKVLDCENILAIPLPDEHTATDPSTYGIAGHIAMTNETGFLHIVVFNNWPQWHARGVGHKLIEYVKSEARQRGFPCIKLGTTNDNVPAIYFYQRAGFVIESVVPAIVEPGHPSHAHGFAGIPIRDEIHMRLDV